MAGPKWEAELDSENMEESLRSLIALLGAAADELGGTSKELDNTEKKLDETSTTSTKLKARLDDLKNQSINGLKIAAGGLVGSLGAIGVQMVGLAKITGELSAAGTEQDLVFNRLSASVNNASSNAAEAREQWTRLQGVIGEQTALTDFGDEEISDGLSLYIDKTNDLTVSSEELSTILGIAAQRQKSVSDAAEIMAKARSGDVEALKELTPLTKDQAATLAKEKDETLRAEKAIAILSKQYAGLANTTGTARGSIKELDDAKGDLVQQGGRLVNQLGLVQAFLDPVTGKSRELEQALADNSVMIQGVAIDIAEGLVTGLEVGTEALYFTVDGAFALAAGMEAIGEGGRIALSVTEIVGRGLLSFGTDVLGAVLEQIGEYADTAEEVARRIGADDLADQIAGAATAVDGFKKKVDEVNSSNMAGIREELDNIEDAGDNIVESMETYRERSEQARQVANQLHEITGGMRDGLAQARANIKPLSDGFNEAAGNAGKLKDAVDDLPSGEGGPSAKEIEQQKARLEIERDLIEAKRAGNEQEEIRLQWVLASFDAHVARKDAANAELADLEEGTALLAADFERRQQIAAMEERIAKERLETEERIAKLREEQRKERVAAAEAERDAIVEAAAIFGGSVSGIDGDLGRITEALGGMTEGIAAAAAEYDVMRSKGMGANDALAASGAIAAGAIGDAAASQIEDTGKAATIRGAFAAAEAGFYFATGNVPMGIATSGAAAGFFLTAALAGQGGGAKGGSAGGATGGANSAERGTLDAEREREKLAKTITDGFKGAGQGGATTNQFVFEGNTFLSNNPEIARQLTDEMLRDLESRGIYLK